MRIYLAGNGSMAKDQRERLYNYFFKYRLLSYYEIQPNRFAHNQWKWLKNENLSCRLCPRK